MSLLDNVGLGTKDGTPPSFASASDQWAANNASPSDIYAFGNSLPQTVGGIPGLSVIPGLGKIPIPGMDKLNKALSPLNAARFSVKGNYEAVHYADDLNYHQPKFKFLFKVKFSGFSGTNDQFYFYVYRADKPKVRFVHQDVNYYNFRSRVLTGVIYEPLALTFLDEVGNNLNDFFSSYLSLMSGTGSGNYGIDQGWGDASSTRPYANGYSDELDRKIIVEQVFAHSTGGGYDQYMANHFTFINPRIETFDFDELSQEDSSSGSMATITFSYDAILCETVNDKTTHSWGATDLLKGGGTSGENNAGNLDGNSLLGTNKAKPVKKSQPSIYGQLQKGADALRKIPDALGGLIMPKLAGIGSAISGTGGLTPSSAGDTVSQSTQGTLNSIQSGANTLPTAAAAAATQAAKPDPFAFVNSLGNGNG